MVGASIPVITLDGPGGAGKGTISLQLAQRLNWHVLDSGALYRAVALAAQDRAVSLEEEMTLADLATHLDIDFRIVSDWNDLKIFLVLSGHSQEITQRLRNEAIAAIASQIAALPQVRQALLFKQRAFQKAPGLIADGRDMGTVVFPTAKFKFFLTASCEERARRRYKQLKEKGIDAKLSTVLAEVVARDKRDSTRATAPLTAAKDAWVIDTTKMRVEAVVEHILKRVSEHARGHLATMRR